MNVSNRRSGWSSVTVTVRSASRATPRIQVACSAMSGLTKSTSIVAGNGTDGGANSSRVDSAEWTVSPIRSRATVGCRWRAACRLIDSLTTTGRIPGAERLRLRPHVLVPSDDDDRYPEMLRHQGVDARLAGCRAVDAYPGDGLRVVRV